MKKPIYKRWWFWVVAIVLIAVIMPKEETPVKEEEKVKAAEEEKEPQKETIKVNKETKLGKVGIDLKSVTIEEDRLSVHAIWNHEAVREKIHFSVLATMSVYQGGEHLKIIDGEDTFLKGAAYMVDSKLDVKYQLIDNKTPIEVRFKTTTDDPEEEAFEIVIDTP